MNSKPYEEYALLSFQIEELKNKQDALKVAIVEHLLKTGEKKIETSIGNIVLQAGKKKWSYPEYVTKAEEDFKTAKAKSESTGEATYEEGEAFIKFNKVKF